jgi:hypothetical protein
MKQLSWVWLLMGFLLALPLARADNAVHSAGLEVARQDMVLSQLTDLINRFSEMRRDMESNPGIGPDAAKATGNVRDRLETLQKGRLNHARKLLEDAVRDPRPNDPRVAEAQQFIAVAAREMGSLLLQAGVSQATEVFATEMREIVRQQLALPARGAATAQTELAERTDTLVNELRALKDSPVDALAAVRLTRARKQVENSGVAAVMRQAAKDMTDSDAAPRQATAVKGLREALLTLRPDRRLEELIRVRTQLQDTAKAQQAMRATLTGLSQDQLATRKATLALQQENILRPLADIDNLLDLGVTLAACRKAGADAVQALRAANAKGTAAAQDLVSQCLDTMLFVVGEEIKKLSSLGETHQRMIEAAERLRVMTGFRDRSEQNRNSAMDLVLANKSLETIHTAETQLVAGLETFAERLPKENRFAASLRRPLARAAKSLREALPSLQANKLDPVLPTLTQADDLLKEGLEIAKRELGMLERLWLYRQTSADIKQINRSLDDLVAEVADLKAGVERAQKEKRTVLDFTANQDLLARALAQLQESVAAIREAGGMREAQELALTAMNKAKAMLEKDQAAPALAAIQEAHEALKTSQKTGNSIVTMIDMLVVELEVTTELSGKAMDIYQRQIALRENTEDEPFTEFKRMAGEQEVLLVESTAMATYLVAAANSAAAFGLAAGEMKLAIPLMKSQSRADAVVHQKKAEEHLLSAIKELDAFLKAFADLQSKSQRSELVTEYKSSYDAMTAILVLATEQRELRELTARTPESLLPNHVAKQSEFSHERIDEILSLAVRGSPVGHVRQARVFMEQAIVALNAKTKDAAIQGQQDAEKELRIAYAKILGKLLSLLEVPVAPGMPAPVPPRERTDTWRLDAKADWKEFNAIAPSGAPPKGTKGEWQSLVDRERSALNENFARELPLEYRKLLKDYYEALSK